MKLTRTQRDLMVLLALCFLVGMLSKSSSLKDKMKEWRDKIQDKFVK